MRKILLLCVAFLAIAVSAEAQSVDIKDAALQDTNDGMKATKIEYILSMNMGGTQDSIVISPLRRRGYPVDYMSMKPYNMLQRPWEVIVLPGLPACIGYNENYYGVGSRFYEEKNENIEKQ